MKYFLSIVLLLVAPLFWAQEANTVLSKSEIEVGEKITLTYYLRYNQEKDFLFNLNKSKIICEKMNKNGSFIQDSSAFEILSPLKDTIIKEPNQKLWTGIFEITVWDTGTYKIPDFSVQFNNQNVSFPSAIFKANLAEKKDSTELFDIKEEFAQLPSDVLGNNEKSFNNRYLWLLIWVALVVLGFVIIRWIIKKKSKNSFEETIDLQQQTIDAIIILEEKQLWLHGKEKEHYSELSFLLRSYFSYCFELNLLEKTTNETMLLLKQLDITPTKINEIQVLLNGADMVKFAKSKPEEDWNLTLLTRAKLIVQNTQPIKSEHAE